MDLFNNVILVPSVVAVDVSMVPRVVPLPSLSNSSPTCHDKYQDQGHITKKPPRGVVVAKIEDILESVLDHILARKDELVINLKPRRAIKNHSLYANSETAAERGINDEAKITFPGRNPHEAWKFTVILRILELSHEALVTGVIMTKRDIYYRDPRLFKKQAVVDQYVDDLAYSFGLPRDALNVVASAKGLAVGALTVIKEDQNVISYATEEEGLLIATVDDKCQVDTSKACWILVVEKEAIFRALATTQYWKHSRAGEGIVVTAKGYPDIQTRAFLKRLSTTKRAALPILGLMDFDPDGLGILSTYKHGSAALAHQKNSLSVPELRWIGVESCDLIFGESSRPIHDCDFLTLTTRDRHLAISMLKNENYQISVEPHWRRELQVMLMLNIKAEIQIICRNGGLTSYLDKRLGQL